MEFRKYRETDYDAVCDFLIELNREDRKHINWNWARFEWMYDHPESDISLIGSVGLWLDGGRIVGAAIYDMYFGEAFCGALPEYADLYPAIIAYAYAELKDEHGLGIAICDCCAAEIKAAAEAGFSPAEQDETVMSIALTDDLPVNMPKGLHIAQLDHNDKADVDALEWLLFRGFDHGSDREEFENSPRGKRVRKHFDPRFSLAAVTEGGEPVSYCCLWLHPDADYAYVEPVCTVPEYRGKGAARAIIFEALNRARALGAKRAYVISDQVFYEKLGFEKELHYTFYWKNCGECAVSGTDGIKTPDIDLWAEEMI